MPPRKSGQRKQGPKHKNKVAYKANKYGEDKRKAEVRLAPTRGCCQRCYDILEWKKFYDKYKPRTAPGVCRLCRQKTVRFAYHAVCTACAEKHEVCAKCGKKEPIIQPKPRSAAWGKIPPEFQVSDPEDYSDEEQDDQPRSSQNHTSQKPKVKLASPNTAAGDGDDDSDDDSHDDCDDDHDEASDDDTEADDTDNLAAEGDPSTQQRGTADVTAALAEGMASLTHDQMDKERPVQTGEGDDNTDSESELGDDEEHQDEEEAA